jgi:hypothetical protein
MPVCAYSLRMSIDVRADMVPWYTGNSMLGLPLLKDRVALLSASFISCFFLSYQCQWGRAGNQGAGAAGCSNFKTSWASEVEALALAASSGLAGFFSF